MAQAKEQQSKAAPPAAAQAHDGRDAAPVERHVVSRPAQDDRNIITPPPDATPQAAPRSERNERGTWVYQTGEGNQ